MLPTLAVQIAWLSPGTHTTALKGREFDWSHFIDKEREVRVLQWPSRARPLELLHHKLLTTEEYNMTHSM